MNWSLLSEKFGREEGSILIFCASEDRNDPWLIKRVQDYRQDRSKYPNGYKVIVKTARHGGSQNQEATADESAATE